MAKRSTIELAKYVRRLSEAGVMRKPTWLQAIEKYPPPSNVGRTGMQGKRPPKLVYEEDEFVAAYYRRNPAATLEPIDLGSFNPPAARRFAFRQLELMKEHGLSRTDAKAKAIQEQSDVSGEPSEDSYVAKSVGERLIEKIQAEEERHLDEAMATFRERHTDVSKLI